jgi:hypothetical protein
MRGGKGLRYLPSWPGFVPAIYVVSVMAGLVPAIRVFLA